MTISYLGGKFLSDNDWISVELTGITTEPASLKDCHSTVNLWIAQRENHLRTPRAVRSTNVVAEGILHLDPTFILSYYCVACCMSVMLGSPLPVPRCPPPPPFVPPLIYPFTPLSLFLLCAKVRFYCPLQHHQVRFNCHSIPQVPYRDRHQRINKSVNQTG